MISKSKFTLLYLMLSLLVDVKCYSVALFLSLLMIIKCWCC